MTYSGPDSALVRLFQEDGFLLWEASCPGAASRFPLQVSGDESVILVTDSHLCRWKISGSAPFPPLLLEFELLGPPATLPEGGILLVGRSAEGAIMKGLDENGVSLWATNVGEGEHRVSGPVVSPGQNLAMIARDSGQIIAVDIKSGNLAWDFQDPRLAGAEIFLAPDGEETLFVGSSSGIVWGLDMQTGGSREYFFAAIPGESPLVGLMSVRTDEVAAVLENGDIWLADALGRYAPVRAWAPGMEHVTWAGSLEDQGWMVLGTCDEGSCLRFSVEQPPQAVERLVSIRGEHEHSNLPGDLPSLPGPGGTSLVGGAPMVQALVIGLPGGKGAWPSTSGPPDNSWTARGARQ